MTCVNVSISTTLTFSIFDYTERTVPFFGAAWETWRLHTKLARFQCTPEGTLDFFQVSLEQAERTSTVFLYRQNSYNITGH